MLLLLAQLGRAVQVPPYKAIRQLLQLAKQGGLLLLVVPSGHCHFTLWCSCCRVCGLEQLQVAGGGEWPCNTVQRPCLRCFLQATTRWRRTACRT